MTMLSAISAPECLSWDIIGLGCVAVDELLYVRNFPAGNTKTMVLRRDRQCGGLTGTALVTASRLGARCAYAGMLGFDDGSKIVEENFRQEQVDVTLAPREKDARVPQSVIVVGTETGSRNIFCRIDGRLGAHDHLPDERTLRSARVLFIDQFGMPGNYRAARIARAAGIDIVADFEEKSGELFEEVFALVDHLVLPEEFALRIAAAETARSAVTRLWRDDRKAVVVTCGTEGAWFCGSDGLVRHQPAFKVVVADTTGCGDVFHGAYAAEVVRGASLSQCVRFASGVAALKATQPGGQRGIPNRMEVQRFLESSPETYGSAREYN